MIDSSEVVDQLWVLVSAMLVFFMHAGFSLLEAGSVEAKSVSSTLVKNVLDTCLTTCVFWVVGLGVAFGEFAPERPDEHAAAYVLYTAFATTAVTITSGSLLGRVALAPYFAVSAATAAFIFPAVARAVWADDGVLSATNDNVGRSAAVRDASGGLVVHVLGGVLGLVGAWAVGPRSTVVVPGGGRAVLVKPGHSTVLVALGTGVLWFSWLPFNASFAGGVADGGVGPLARSVLGTMLGGAAGGLSISAFRTWLNRRVSVPSACSGVLAGLAAVTAGSPYFEPWASALVGAAAGVLADLTTAAVARAGVDDAAGVVPVHLTGGAIGTLAVGAFADGRVDGVTGFFYGDDGSQMAAQLVGLAAVLAWGALSGAACFYVAGRALGGLRISGEDEKTGLDAKVGGSAFPDWFRLRTELVTMGGELEWRVNTSAGRVLAASEAVERTRAEHDEQVQQSTAVLEAQGRFLSTMSHELRTPLSGLMACSQMLQEDDSASGEQRETAEAIAMSAAHLNTVISDILDFDKLNSGAFALHPTVCSPLLAVENAVTLAFSPALHAGVALSHLTAAGGAADCAWADAVRLRQVVLNLVSNALKFTASPGGAGRVAVFTDAVGRAEAAPGVGPPESVQRSFETRWRAPRDYGGDGDGDGDGDGWWEGAPAEAQAVLDALVPAWAKVASAEADAAGPAAARDGSPPSTHRVLERESLLRVRVCDTGPGVEADKMDRMFVPFSQVYEPNTKAHAGTGLGLIICAKLVHLMRGRMWVESVRGEGCTFTFVVPVRAAMPVNAPAPARALPLPGLPGGAAPLPPLRVLAFSRDHVAALALARHCAAVGGARVAVRYASLPRAAAVWAASPARAWEAGQCASAAEGAARRWDDRDGAGAGDDDDRVGYDVIVVEQWDPFAGSSDGGGGGGGGGGRTWTPDWYSLACCGRNGSPAALVLLATEHFASTVAQSHSRSRSRTTQSRDATVEMEPISPGIDLVEDDNDDDSASSRALRKSALLASLASQTVVLARTLPLRRATLERAFDHIERYRGAERVGRAPRPRFSPSSPMPLPSRRVSLPEREHKNEAEDGDDDDGDDNGHRRGAVPESGTGVLPQASASRPGSREALARKAVGRVPRVLVVDDNRVNRMIAQRVFRRVGLEPDMANDGLEAVNAVQAAAEAGQPYDVVWLDVQMPVMDGVEAARRIAADRAGGRVPVIVALTASAHESDRRSCLETMDEYEVKPLRPDAALATLEKYCGWAPSTPLPAAADG